MSRAQVVRPAGAGHETLYVLLAALVIVLLAAAVVGVRGAREDEVALGAHEIDARRDLTPAEQGLYTDLRVAADEMRLLREDTGSSPDIALLAEEGLPPFVVDASSESRGRHQWQRLSDDAYLGRSQAAEVAGSFLLLLPAGAGTEPVVWLRRQNDATPPPDRSATALADAGWQQVVSHYDAGVTRQHRH
ncbi:DUF6162 family protein [Pseudomonas phoenicis]|uniref:DUF6162 family protein n=1 Tax=unclassified Pseudomonas TaxID=196821 RepID=UPI0039A2CDD2